MSVYDAEDKYIGEIEEILFDPGSWMISDLRIALDGDYATSIELTNPWLGYLAVLVEPDLVNDIGNSVYLDIDDGELKSYLDGRIQKD